MRKHFYLTMLLLAGLPMLGTSVAYAAPEPQSQSQNVTVINGTVLDENNEAVIGASVAQKGVKGNAVATDAFGHFKIRVAPGTQLEVSYVGYKPSTIAAAQDMTVYLQPTTEVLNELVAIGYGSQKRANLTGAVSTVDVARTMESRPVQDVTRALQGTVPGLTITTSNGDFNATPTIKIRGTGTLSNSQNSSPLIVVDGVPVDDMSNLNPEDIADISVLKDAASASIYGTRAAFGVILITTKSGQSRDHVSLKYVNNFAWSNASYYPEFANTVDDLETALQGYARAANKPSNEIFGTYYWDILPYAKAWQKQHGGKQYTSAVELQPFESWDNVGDYAIMDNGQWVRYADWNTGKTLFQTAPSQKHNISLEGTSGKTSYRISFGYDAKEGLMKYNPEKLSRYMANASIQTEIFPWLKAGGRLAFFNRTFKEPNFSRNSYQYMWRFPSFFETYGYVKDDNGTPYYFRNEMGLRNGAHQDVTKVNQTRLQTWIQAEIIKDLTVQADFTYAVRNMNYNSAYTPATVWNNWTTTPFTLFTVPSQGATTSTRQAYRNDMFTVNVFATYDKTIAQDHNLKIMVGGTAERNQYDMFYVRRSGLLDNSLPSLNLTDGNTYSTQATMTNRATAGFFGRVNYDYKGIYLFEANGRYDGSSRFPADDQWAFFPSFSLGYRFSEEAYFAPVKNWWSNGKLRFSYGHIGNEAVGDNMFISTISPITAGNVHWLQNGIKVSEAGMPTLVSNSLTWERVVTTDVGLDLGFFDNSLTFGFDWYERTTKDMLAPGEVLPSVLGQSAPYQNAGELQTRGWELSLGWNKSFGDWDVYATFAISDARTKVTKWNNPNELLYTYTPGSSNFTAGQYYGDIWGFETDRYFEESDFTSKNEDGSWNYAEGVANQSGLENLQGFHYGPGDVKYKDLDGNGVINNGINGRIKLHGRIYDPGDEGYDEAALNPDAKKLAVGSLENHGDLKVIGNAMPRFEYSFRLGGAYKGFDLDIFFQGVGKRNYWATGSLMVPMAASNLGTYVHQQSYNHYNIQEGVDEKGTPTYTVTGYNVDQSNRYPNMVNASGSVNGTINNIGRGTANFYPQSRYLLNLSYLRIKSLTFGYTLPAEITTKALIQKARIYFSADNLCDIHNGVRDIKMDPEITQSYGGLSNDGYGGFGRTVPMMRTYSFGLQVTF